MPLTAPLKCHIRLLTKETGDHTRISCFSKWARIKPDLTKTGISPEKVSNTAAKLLMEKGTDPFTDPKQHQRYFWVGISYTKKTQLAADSLSYSFFSGLKGERLGTTMQFTFILKILS